MNNLAKSISALQFSGPAAQTSCSPSRLALNSSLNIDSSGPPGTYPPMTVISLSRLQVTIERFLAEGGFAHVYLAILAGDSQRVVLKRIACSDKASLEELRQEVEIHKQVSGHKNIVRFLDSSIASLQAGGYEVLILMEYCEGGHLVDFLNTRLDTRLTEDEVLRIFSDVCEAVAHMHSLQPCIAHRDIKIENVLIAGNGSCKLCDFGSCTTRVVPPNAILNTQDIWKLEEEIRKFTTLPYRSPEMCDLYQKRGLSEQVDAWAMGVLLYKLCFFTTPFEEGGMLAILNVRYTFPSFPQYSPKLISLIQSLLEIDVAKRFDIFQAYSVVCEMRHTPYNLPKRSIPSKQPGETSSSMLKSTPRVTETVQNSAANGFGPSPTYVNGVSVSGITPMRRGRPKSNATDLSTDNFFMSQSLVNIFPLPDVGTPAATSVMSQSLAESPFVDLAKFEQTMDQHKEFSSLQSINQASQTSKPCLSLSQPFVPDSIWTSSSNITSRPISTLPQSASVISDYTRVRGHTSSGVPSDLSCSLPFSPGRTFQPPPLPFEAHPEAQNPQMQSSQPKSVLHSQHEPPKQQSFWEKHSPLLTNPSFPESPPGRRTVQSHSRPFSWGGPMSGPPPLQRHPNDPFFASIPPRPPGTIDKGSPNTGYITVPRPNSTGEWSLPATPNGTPFNTQQSYPHTANAIINNQQMAALPDQSMFTLSTQMPIQTTTSLVMPMQLPMLSSPQMPYGAFSASVLPASTLATDLYTKPHPNQQTQPPAKPPRKNRLSIQATTSMGLSDIQSGLSESNPSQSWQTNFSSQSDSKASSMGRSIPSTSPSHMDVFGRSIDMPLLSATSAWQPLVPTPATSDPPQTSVSHYQ
ncbi:hypothetical protein BATDEDRAFT_92853 [Batrachochytrium dendrobatidis JAM81]|uniref:non-specific serine/threonine protein kinase n=1 Tax=Batrachochytrium dendrobatidis (strain JAM81 / FGSC 10211) TaxID=684364 RepID=F4PEK4_BATDJ|nr:uncharacterized protein BATDEDRAFT_92853 [Batrachochytrium dendrobatidis JAM81]EGF76260.1 hypothetical protein BATDEDRAFT_92853 [Batrachochytrium dendrobatidis JAM81]|eukprot:XP_006683092.1 hypothetical protein BATDEDRAFT_92853 [Batrachochytrium dendrobatidis JAM81]